MRSLTLISLLLTATLAHAETKVAVLPLEARTGVDEKTAALLTDMVTSEVSKRTDLRVLGPSEIKSLVNFEQQRSQLGCTEDSCLAEIGAALGVDVIVTGSVGKVEGSVVVLNLSLVDIKKTTVLRRTTETAEGGTQKLLPLLPHMVGTLMQGIPGGPPPPVRPAPSATTTPAAGTPSTAAKDEGSGSSTLPRRVAGLSVAGAGALLLTLGVVAGASSVGWLVLTKVAPVSGLPGHLGFAAPGFALAGGADLLGILGVAITAGGLVLAALP